MQFAQSHMFYLFWGVLVLGLFLRWAFRHHQKMMRRFIQKPLIKKIAKDFDSKRLMKNNILLVLVFVLSVFALSRPQWGFQWQEVKREGIDILLLVDVSKSMLTQDVKPNRLERTKLAVKDLIKKLRGDRIGLIAFAGDAFLLCPLTVDYNGFVLSLNELNTETIPRGGTNMANAIEEAMKNYDKTPSKFRVLIIITDGDDLEGDPLAMAKKAKESGVKIYTIGIGTKDGELIQLRDEFGNKAFLKDRQGNFVKSRLNEKLLQSIALSTGGIYVKASGAQFGLDLIYERTLAKLERREMDAKMEKRFYERFQIPLALAVLLLIIETCATTKKIMPKDI